MLVILALLLGGAAVLAVGAEAAVRGASRLAIARGVPVFVIGALLFGVDVESLGAALTAAGAGATSLAAGEAFGTVVFVFSAAFGAALIVAPRPVDAPSRPMVLLPGGALLAGAVTLADQVVTRPEGLLLLLVYGAYVAQVVREGRSVRARGEHIVREARESPRLPWALLLGGGLALVYAGAAALVQGGLRVVEHTSLSAGFVGAAIVGALASADEVLLEILPIRRGLPALATGNLFGTAAAFGSGVLGLAALVRPLVVDTGATMAFAAAATLYTVVAVVFLARGRAWRLLGGVVLAGYGAWLALASSA